MYTVINMKSFKSQIIKTKFIKSPRAADNPAHESEGVVLHPVAEVELSGDPVRDVGGVQVDI